jgi:hypothetical protein
MKRIRTLAILNAVAFLIQLSVSWLTQSRMINSEDVGQVSDKYPTLFTPAGITFAIWGLIYLSLGAFCIYHIIMAWRRQTGQPPNQELQAIGNLFVLNNLATAAWLYAWTHEWIALSLGLIVFQLFTLIAMHIRLHIYDKDKLPGSKLFTQIPLSIYFGWITVATIANTDVYLSVTGWGKMGVSDAYWTIFLIGLAVFMAILVVLIRRNISYGLVFIWALGGIVIKRMGDAAHPYPEILLAAETGMIVLSVVCLLQLARNMRHTRLERIRHIPFPLAPHSLK